MSSRSRRQTRQCRSDGWPPEWHNEAVQRRKANIRDAKRWEAARRARARARAHAALRTIGAAAGRAADGIRTLNVALIGFGQAATAIREAAERQRAIAHADTMAFLGFDMRDEHDALERGEVVE